ncbi:MAG: hypothetical protein J0H62_06170, partial [Rhizobiales bacterium]|nr:hypothetical protein [Hyphomicrobiales bacterium]
DGGGSYTLYILAGMVPWTFLAGSIGEASTCIIQNEALIRRPELLNEDAFGAAWMLIVRPADENWRAGLVTGANVQAAFDAWFASDAYRDRAE